MDTVCVICQGHGRGGILAARLWYILSYLGVKDVRILDGGLAVWQSQGLPTTDALSLPRPLAIATLGPELTVSFDVLTVPAPEPAATTSAAGAPGEGVAEGGAPLPPQESQVKPAPKKAPPKATSKATMKKAAAKKKAKRKVRRAR